MDSAAFRDAAAASIEEIIKYYETLESRPVVSGVEPGYLRTLLPSEAPQHGEEWKDIQKDIEAKIVPGITHWQSPNFFAFFPCPSSYPSILGEMYSATFAAAAFNWICSPAITELETIVLDWLAKLLGLPETYLSTGPTLGGGVIHGTASEALLTMMVAARDKHLRETTPHAFADGVSDEQREDELADRRGRLVALATSAAHTSTKKAARILGLRLRTIPVSAATGYALTADALQAALDKCRADGLEPFYLTTTLGTTDTCAVDDFKAVGDVLVQHRAQGGADVWVHVDAAYAGSALVCPEFQESVGVSHLERFHSFNFNMHKWMLTNFDASCVFVRDRRWLASSLGADWHVYANAFSAGGLVTDYRDWQIPLGRRFRSLKIWFVLRSYGADGLRAYIRRSVQLGERFARGVSAATAATGPSPVFDILTGPDFALTVFRMAGRDDAERNERTARLYEAVNASGKLWATSTRLDGTSLAIRIMTANRLTREEHVDKAVELFVATAGKILAEST